MAQLNKVGPQPSYHAAPTTAGNEQPPTYDSLFGQIKASKANSSNSVMFLSKLFTIFCKSIGCTIVTLLILGIPITMIVIGAVYKNDCKAQDKIPIFLIVGGTIGLVRNLLCVKKTKDGESEDDDNKADKGTIFDVFLFAWLITGSVWVYKIHEPDYKDKSSSRYCNETLYKFAFGLITANWSLMGLFCCCCFSVLCLSSALGEQ